MKLKDSKTYLNLARAYAGECQARTRYEFVEYGFRYNGYEAIAQTIDKIVYQEFNHARMIYTFIQKADTKEIKDIEVCAGYPFREKWELAENLKLIAEDEAKEAEVYDEFIKIAEQEGFLDIALLFKNIRDVEIRHRDVFLELHKQFTNNELYEKDKETIWYCPACGYYEKGTKSWDKCPLCEAKQGTCNLVFPDGFII
ncbi:MAG: rubrerythrin family protein [Christensenellales bacterium]